MLTSPDENQLYFVFLKKTLNESVKYCNYLFGDLVFIKDESHLKTVASKSYKEFGNSIWRVDFNDSLLETQMPNETSLYSEENVKDLSCLSGVISVQDNETSVWKYPCEKAESFICSAPISSADQLTDIKIALFTPFMFIFLLSLIIIYATCEIASKITKHYKQKCKTSREVDITHNSALIPMQDLSEIEPSISSHDSLQSSVNNPPPQDSINELENKNS